jgi:hypothetical protein
MRDDHTHCPNDASCIPWVAEVSVSGPAFRFYWCWSCAELFVFNTSTDKLTASFGEDGDGWRLFSAAAEADEVSAATQAAAQVRLPR